MTAQPSAHDFQALLHAPCRVSVGGIGFDLTVAAVQSYQRTLPSHAARIPFTVVLAGPPEPSFHYGLFTLAAENGFAVDEVYIERIAAPLEADNDMAYYQIVFS